MVTTDQGSCHVCSSPATQKCAGCQSVFYCSRDHQKQHWKRHKQACTPARVRQGEGVGRYLETTRDIKSGEVVMKEKPIVVGPALVTPPVCLGCYKLLEEGSTVDCAKCGWPFCSEACTASEAHKPECFYTQQRGTKVKITVFGTTNPNYQCITTLRCLYQRDHDPKVWEKLQSLQSHCEERKVTEKWAQDKKVVVDFILKFFKLEGKFSEEEIMKCCGILQINGHEVPLTEPEHLAVYSRVSMIEHHCRANCNKSFTSDGEILLSATSDIPANSHISVCYTDALCGTETRRHHLAQGWLFECACARCCDVTECGTMYSATKCNNKGCKGYLLPETFIRPILTNSSDPEQQPAPEQPWKCNTCKDEVANEIIQKMLHDIGNEIANMPKGDPDACERFISHCASYLHPSHYYMTDVSMALAQMIGQQAGAAGAGAGEGGEGGLPAVSEDRLLLKTQLCRKCADLLEVLAPAEIRTRGSILFELHAAIAETGRRRGMTEGPTTMLGYIHESRKILKEAAQLLRHEPPELPEGKIYQQAKINLIQMDQLIDQLSAALPSPL